MKKQKYFWKVVQVNVRGEFTSYVLCDGLYALIYKLNEITHPKIGKIFVFRTRKQARNFKLEAVKGKILKVEVDPETVCPQKYRSSPKGDVMKRFWNDQFAYAYKSETPEGTYGATWVKPIEISH
jgi:hypothetical protein